jgi:hypothetical protein
MTPHMQTTHLALMSLSNISQSQLVILRHVTNRKRGRNRKLHKILLNAKQWRLSNALTKTKSTMPRVCATTATTNTVETATPMLVLTRIDSSMPKENARTVILMTITSSKEDSRKINLHPTMPSNSSTRILSLKDLNSQNRLLKGLFEDAHQTFYQYMSADIIQ